MFRRGAGALFEVEHIERDLGQHGEARVVAQVQHRVLRLGLGREQTLRVTLGRWRPESIEVTGGGAVTRVKIPRPGEPWARAGLRLLLLWVASSALLAAWQRLRSATRGGRA